MNRLFFPLTFPKRSHLLWLAGLRALQPLRPACSRTTTFLWLVLVLAALCLRPDLAGVTSLVRSLGLSDASYYCLLHFFHSPALNLERLTQLWRRTLQHLFRRCLVQVNGRPVVVVDGLKRPKEGRKMPAVKSLHQESRCNAKASFIMRLFRYLSTGESGMNLPLSSPYERPQIRLPPVAEEPRLHRRGRAHARAGHRGEHGDLQRGQRSVAAPTAVSGA